MLRFGIRGHRLTDGTLVVARPLLASDRAAFRAGLARISPESWRFRFRAGTEDLTETELDHLLDVDQRNHAAWAAMRLPGPEGIGVARYIRIPGETRAAEVAILVLDAWQGQGVGQFLLDELVPHARSQGIELLIGEVARDNVRALALFRRQGARLRHAAGAIEVYWELNPVSVAADAPSAAGR